MLPTPVIGLSRPGLGEASGDGRWIAAPVDAESPTRRVSRLASCTWSGRLYGTDMSRPQQPAGCNGTMLVTASVQLARLRCPETLVLQREF